MNYQDKVKSVRIYFSSTLTLLATEAVHDLGIPLEEIVAIARSLHVVITPLVFKDCPYVFNGTYRDWVYQQFHAHKFPIADVFFNENGSHREELQHYAEQIEEQLQIIQQATCSGESIGLFLFEQLISIAQFICRDERQTSAKSLREALEKFALCPTDNLVSIIIANFERIYEWANKVLAEVHSGVCGVGGQ